MTYFPHHSLRRAASLAAPAPAVRPRLARDILWNQPVFKAPALPNPRVLPAPLPCPSARFPRRGQPA